MSTILSEVAQSRLTLCDLWTVVCQAPPSTGFSSSSLILFSIVSNGIPIHLVFLVSFTMCVSFHPGVLFGSFVRSTWSNSIISDILLYCKYSHFFIKRINLLILYFLIYITEESVSSLLTLILLTCLNSDTWGSQGN